MRENLYELVMLGIISVEKRNKGPVVEYTVFTNWNRNFP